MQLISRMKMQFSSMLNMRIYQTLAWMFILTAIQVSARAQGASPSEDSKLLLASLHPTQELRWQRTSPSTQSLEGPVLYQLVFRFVAHDNTLVGTGSIAQPLGIASGGVGASQLASSAVQAGNIATGQVVKNLNGLFDGVTLAAGTGISVTPSGQTLTIANTAPATLAWGLTGNASTGCTASPCTNFIGTTDNTALEIHVMNTRAFRIEPATDPGFGFSPNVIGGFSGNVVTGAGVAGATIAGGGVGIYINTVSARFGTVGGGLNNVASGDRSTVAGGDNNTAGSSQSAVAGGYLNTASGGSSTVSGGQSNTASGGSSAVAGGNTNIASGTLSSVAGGNTNVAGGIESTVSGGAFNVASGDLSTVAGGQNNTASGSYSFAAGYRANTNGHSGAFVWGDTSSATDVKATLDNQVTVRAIGGVNFFTNIALTTGCTLPAAGTAWTCTSDRNVKENFQPVDGREVLAHVMAVPISTWNAKGQAAAIRHMGPMAQDFYAAFGLGEDDKHISVADEPGVALAAIQGLNQKLEEDIRQKDKKIAALQEQMEAMRADINVLLATFKK